MKAIIIVDCQNDFSDTGSLPVKGATDLGKQIAEFIAGLDRAQFKIISSCDWHPLKHISFKKWPVHCVAHTPGAQYIKPLDALKFDLEIRKGTDTDIDSYSAFYENNNLSKIKQYLTNNKISQVYICGLVKDICVLHTANDSAKFGFVTSVIEDLTIALNENNYVAKINKHIKNVTAATVK